MNKRLACACLVLLPLMLHQAHAQTSLPNKPVRLVVGAPPGGAPDTVARLVAQHMNVGQPVVVENKNGASQMIAAEFVVRAPADGSVLLLASQTAIGVSPVLQKVKFDPIKDFTGLALIGTAPLVLVAGPSLPANSVKELVAYAKTNPGKVDFGNGGVGTSPHMAGVLFGVSSGVQLNSVPYPGEQAAMIDIMAGRIHMMFANASSAMPHVRSGKLRALAVTSDARAPVAPELPTMPEADVPGFSAATWLGIVAPAATPKPVVTQLNAELNRVLALPEVREKLATHGFTVEPMGTDDFNRFLAAEHAKWGKLIRDANIKAN
jgi:tripartite-type tricarboxylate transporter receptor subunit TctC